MKRSQTRRLICGAMLAGLLPFGASAQSDYPSKPITMVVPFAAGGVTDTVARLVGKELTTAWKQPVIIENRPGATGVIGSDQVARAPKDGYTLLFSITSHVQVPSLRSKMPFDALKDFEPVTQVALSSNVLAVSSTWPIKSVKELVAKLKAEPGRHAYGSYGAGSTANIYGELFNKDAELGLAHVPYKGAAPLTSDMVAGHVNIAFLDVGTAMPYIQAGKVRPLAMVGERRSSLLPDVPTMQELGYKGFQASPWMGIFAPAGTPKDRVSRLSAEVARIVRYPVVNARLREMNLEPVGDTPAEFSASLRKDLESWKLMIDRTGISME